MFLGFRITNGKIFGGHKIPLDLLNQNFWGLDPAVMIFNKQANDSIQMLTFGNICKCFLVATTGSRVGATGYFVGNSGLGSKRIIQPQMSIMLRVINLVIHRTIKIIF